MVHNPDNIEALLGVASALASKGQVADAVGVLESAKEAQRSNPQVALRLGDLYMQQGSLPKACVQYERASALAAHTVAVDKRVLKKRLSACLAGGRRQNSKEE
jgi:Flp pilus assembly protein TadD